METLTYLHHACVYETGATKISDRGLSALATVDRLSNQAIRFSELTHSLDRGRSPQDLSLKLLRLVLSFLVFGFTNFGLVNWDATQQAQAAIAPGDRGAAVIDLQSRLARLGYFPPTATGFYGTETTDAVTRFQQDHLLLVDGIAGRETLAVLREREEGITTAVVPFTPTVNVVTTNPVTTNPVTTNLVQRPVNVTTPASDRPPSVFLNPALRPAPVPLPSPLPTTPQPTTPATPATRTYETPISAFFNVLDCGRASCF